MGLGMRYDDDVHCDTCDAPMKKCVDWYEYWGSRFSDTTYECRNISCPECEDYDGSREEDEEEDE